MLHLPVISVTVNLYSSVVRNKKGQTLLLTSAANNNREERARPETEHKSVGGAPIATNFADEAGAYGYKWAEVTKGKRNAQPTFEEMMQGIFNWYHK